MKKVKTSGLILAVLMGFWCSVANADVHKCLDGKGKTSYQETKCPPVDKKVSTIKPADKIKVETAADAQDKIQALVLEGKKKDLDFEKQIKAKTEFYDFKIAFLKKQNLATNLVEQEKFLTIKAILEEQAKAKEKNISDLKAEEKKQQDKAKQAEQEIKQLKIESAQKINDIKNGQR